MVVMVSTVGSVLKTAWNLSDHIPVSDRLRLRKYCTTIPPIPLWVARHPFFPKAAERSPSDYGDLPEAPMDAVIIAKDILRKAARAVRNVCKLRGAQTADERVHWILAALRGAQFLLLDRVLEAAQAYPAIAPHFYVETCSLRNPAQLRSKRICGCLSKIVLQRSGHAVRCQSTRGQNRLRSCRAGRRTGPPLGGGLRFKECGDQTAPRRPNQTRPSPSYQTFGPPYSLSIPSTVGRRAGSYSNTELHCRRSTGN